MRTFIAVPLPSECRETLEKMQRPMRSLGADVRWISIASIHLTLKFLGEVEPDLVPKLASALRSVPAEPFALCIRGLGAFPNLQNPRVIWCGIEGEVQKLAALQAEVESVCEALGMAREQRVFHPHLTMGRVTGKRNLQPLLDYIRIGAGPESAFAAHCVDIYRSVLTPRGAIYTVLESVALMGRR
jgi:2'-5' RNA ligase